MGSGGQALEFCLDSTMVVVMKIINKLKFEMRHRIKVLKIEELYFEKSKEVFHDSIVETIAFTAHTLPDTLFVK